MNYTAAPPTTPSYAPQAPQYRPQASTQPIYYSALPPPPPSAAPSPIVHHYAPTPSQAPQYQPPVPRASQPTQRVPPPQTPGPSFDPTIQDQSKQCEYHRGAPGHTLDTCWRLRERIQEMIDAKELVFNAVRPPNVQANPLPDHGSAPGPSINMITVCTSSEGEGKQDGPSPVVIEYVSAEVAVGFAGVDAPHAPLVIDVPTRDPYSNDRVPWTYEGSVGTWSGNLVESLIRVLTAAQVPKGTPSDRIEETINSIFSSTISFSDDELPFEGCAHFQALHIVCKCNNHIVGRVMIDNGSALNVCPVTTLKQMNVDLNRIRPSKTAVRAFDGSRREVNGEIDLLIDIGPCSFSVTFQVLDIPNAFSLLLGRPWIYSAGAIPSSLHQKVNSSSRRRSSRGIPVPPLLHFFPGPPLIIESTSDGPSSDFDDTTDALPTVYSVTEEIPSGEDKIKTTFTTMWGTFCYRVMPFGLKNAGATYQRAKVTLFHDMMHKEVEVYVDDMIAKSKEGEDHLVNLKRLFDRLMEYKLRLNPAKCTFGARSGKLLGFLVSERGIEVDPDKVKAIKELPPPSSAREVRDFLGRLNYIARFIANLTDKCQPLFRLLRKNAAIEWDEECQKAFDTIKAYLAQPLVLVPPTPVLISPDGHYYPVAAKIDFSCTNNVAEYEACILGLQAAIDFKVKELEVFGDSMLTIFQTLGQWKTKDAKLVPYHEYLEKLTENFEDISFTYTPRMTNQFADALATLTSMVSITKENLIEPLEIEKAEGPAHCNSIEASEAKPCGSKLSLLRFLRRDVIARYGVPATIITDNAKNLNNKVIDELCAQFKIRHRNSTPYRPQMNGAVEAANKNIKKIIEKMTMNYKDWHEMLPYALLAYRTSIWTSTGATPYSLVYGMEAVLPIEAKVRGLEGCDLAQTWGIVAKCEHSCGKNQTKCPARLLRIPWPRQKLGDNVGSTTKEKRHFPCEATPSSGPALSDASKLSSALQARDSLRNGGRINVSLTWRIP
ncbi:hypothetical protein CRG98_036611 [Punica granatum]|uniref:Integrase catalytic domain-containing protein n=1 Tax=Punica granatum TaxID=22663 RepID=A0A2I0IG73_PUNGR|nr:hypothetical protein CRG98_036611 [Punica granatum]